MKLELPKGFSVRTLEIENEQARYVITRVNLPSIGDGFLLAVRAHADFGTTRFRSIDAGRRVDGETEPRFESIEAALEAVKEDAAGLSALSRAVTP